MISFSSYPNLFARPPGGAITCSSVEVSQQLDLSIERGTKFISEIGIMRTTVHFKFICSFEYHQIYRVYFFTGPGQKSSKYGTGPAQ